MAKAAVIFPKMKNVVKMNNNDKTLQEQEAPLKNSDDAFVQVGHNGEPVISNESDKIEREDSTSDRDDSQRRSWTVL